MEEEKLREYPSQKDRKKIKKQDLKFVLLSDFSYFVTILRQICYESQICS